MLLYAHLQHDNDTINKQTPIITTQKYFFNKIFTSHFIYKGSKRVTEGLRVRGSWTPNRNCNILTPLLWPSTLCLSRSREAQTEAQGPLCWVMAFFIATYQYLLRTPIHQGPKPLRPGVAFPTTSRLQLSATQLAWLLSWLSYIRVQRPLDHPRDLWNRMFNRHQAEITVMQFRGHSLPVRQSMRVSWDFFFTSSLFISQFPPTRFPLITVIRMCHFLPVHHLEWHFRPGQKVKT